MSTPKMRDQVLECLPPAPAELTAKQVHERLGCWAFRTVKGALLDMAVDGTVVRGGKHDLPTFRRAA